MFYRLMITANFTDIPPVDYLRRIRDYFLDNAITINPGQDNEELSFYQFHKCFHDDNPNEPCKVIDEHYTD